MAETKAMRRMKSRIGLLKRMIESIDKLLLRILKTKTSESVTWESRRSFQWGMRWIKSMGDLYS